jgi:hypothetical protein
VTFPGGMDGVDQTQWGITGDPELGDTPAALAARDQESVMAQLKAEKIANSPGWNAAKDGVYAGQGITGSLGLSGGTVKALLQRVTGMPLSVTGGGLPDILQMFTGIPASQIFAGGTQNLLLNPQFTYGMLSWVESGLFDWVVDFGRGHDLAGSAKVVADGTLKTLHSEGVWVQPGDQIDLSVWHEFEGGTATGTPIKLVLEALDLFSVVSSTLIGEAAGDGTSGWTQIVGDTFVVPSGVVWVRAKLIIDTTMTAGTVWFDDVELAKGGVIQTDALPNIAAGDGPGQSSDLRGIVDGITTVFSGLEGSDYAVANANTALVNVRSTIDQAVTDLQEIKANQGAAANSGQSFITNFTGLPNGISVPGLGYTLTYPDTGVGVPDIYNGGLRILNSAADTMEVRIISTSITDGDYQLIGVTFLTGPGVNCRATIFGRSDATGDNSIELRITTDGWGNAFFSLGRNVSGVWSQWVPPTALTVSTSTIWLECGTSGGARIYRVLAGNTVQITHPEVGTASMLGAGYRQHGVGGYLDSSGGHPYHPGKISAISCADNQPPATVGSFARAYRSTGTVGTAAGGTGDQTVPAGTFNTVDRITSDWTLVNGNSFQLSPTTGKAGDYLVKVGLKNDAAQINGGYIEPLLYVTPDGGSPAIKERGGWKHVFTGAPFRFSEVFQVYLNPGDTITPGANSSLFAPAYSGGADGTETYMTVGMANVSTN